MDDFLDLSALKKHIVCLSDLQMIYVVKNRDPIYIFKHSGNILLVQIEFILQIRKSNMFMLIFFQILSH